jgi:uncharacterized beta-barrel protein YwiB (DUF1934 family)
MELTENNALITLKGGQQICGQRESYEIVTVGAYQKDGENYTVVYEGSELTGYEGATTRLEVSPTAVSMLRFGAGASQMFFETGSKFIGRYNTPFGDFDVGVFTNSMDVNLNENGGDVRLEYLIDLNHQGPVQNDLTVHIERTNQENELL